MGKNVLLADAASSSVLAVAGTDARVCLRLLADNEALLMPVMKAFRCGEQVKSSMEKLFFATRLERFLSAERGGVMSAP